MKLRLKYRLMIMFFLSITIPLLILGIVSTMKTSSSMQKKTEESSLKIITVTAKNIEDNIKAIDSNVNILSENPLIINLADGAKENKIDAYNFIKSVQEENNVLIESLIVTNNQGQAIITNESENPNVSVSDREYVQETLKGNKSISKDVLISKITNNKIIAIAYPLKVSDKIVGTVIALVSFDELTRDISNLKMGETGYGFMLNADGLIIRHPQVDKEFKENASDTTNEDLKIAVEKMKKGETGTAFYTDNGVKKFIGFTYVGQWSIALMQEESEIMKASQDIKIYTILISIISLIVSMIAVYFISSKSILNPIRDLEKLMDKAGTGDLTVKSNINTNDELQTLGESFNEMIKNQSEIIKSVRNNAEDLAASSEEISASTEEISASTELITENIKEVDESLQSQNKMMLETSGLLSELTSLIKTAQNKASITKNNSDNTMVVAKTGRVKVEETVLAIKNINKATIETEEALKSLNNLSEKIVGIIGTINSISEQTNLLALNAAIEAARAGEQGRGFSVVAEEIRKLSEESSIGAKEISILVNNMVSEIKKAVGTMNSSKQAVEKGVIVANDTDIAFVDIIKSIEQIVNDIDQIVDIAKDEVANSENIVNITNSVSIITDNTAKSSHEVASASQDQYSMISNITESSQVTSTMAMKLNELVDKFIIK